MNGHDYPGIYRESREHLLEVATSLSPSDWDTSVPACPDWTVKDLYGHLAGIAADVRDGRLEGVTTDEWTARQVDERRLLPPDKVCAEFSVAGAALEGQLAEQGKALAVSVMDLWMHEQDVLNAVGRPGRRSGPGLSLVLRAARTMDGPIRHAGLPALRVRAGEYDREMGDGPATATVSAGPYEMARAVFGRRSRDQIRRFAWEGDPEPYLEIFSVFPPRSTDLVE